KWPEAEAEYRLAIRLKPDFPQAHNDLGLLLRLQGKLPEAEAEFRLAIRFDSNYPRAYCNLGFVLRQQGRYAESLAAFRRGHELGSKQPGWPYPSAQWVREAEELAKQEKADARLQAILKGTEKVADADEAMKLADLCGRKKRHAAEVKLYALAFALNPELA